MLRRDFLKNTGAMVMAESIMGSHALHAQQTAGKLRAYVGTYTTPTDGNGNGEGIYLFDVDTQAGELSNRRLVAKTTNPSWISIHPSKKYLYAINEVANFAGGNGSVSAFSIDAASGDLAPLNTVSSAGAGPAHMSLDASGKFAFVANYVGGSIAVLPIDDDGRLGDAVDVHQDTGSVGALHPSSGPRGNFAISGHDKPHAHMIAADPSNKFVLNTDLGQDRIYIYRLDAATGKLTPNDAPVSLPSGDGPRHFVFHPNGRWLYLVCEESSTLVLFHFDAAHETLTAVQTISALPAGFAGTSFGAEIQISADGKFLYSGNRLHNTISICSIASDGQLTLLGEQSSMGDYPRYFGIEPGGSLLFACAQRSDSIASFHVDRATGMLTFTGKYAPVGSPAMIAFFA
jgi:6-phosphogluconolactonase (cycloisomerase 2 family)